MMLRRNKVFLCFITATCLVSLKVSTGYTKTLTIDSDDQFNFAYTCMEQGAYGRAVDEFERFIHFFPEDPQVSMARFLVGKCQLEQGAHETARRTFYQVISRNRGSRLEKMALLMIGESYHRQGVSGEAERYFNQVIMDDTFPDLKNAAIYRLGWTRMHDNRWHEASEAFSRVEKGSDLYPSSQQLAEQSLSGEMLPQKNPMLAASLAAVVPGLGHAYASRYGSAAVAFLLNGLFTWAAVEAFHEDQEVLGGILTFFELGWYGGNIYSAMNVTHKYNRKIQDDFRKGLKDHLDFRLFIAPQGHAGLALTFQF